MYEQCTRMLPRNDALWTGVQNEVTLSSVQTTRTVRLRSRLTFRSGRHFTQVTKDDTTPQYPYSSPTRDRPRVHMRHYHSQNRTSVLRHPSHKHRAKNATGVVNGARLAIPPALLEAPTRSPCPRARAICSAVPTPEARGQPRAHRCLRRSLRGKEPDLALASSAAATIPATLSLRRAGGGMTACGRVLALGLAIGAGPLGAGGRSERGGMLVPAVCAAPAPAGPEVVAKGPLLRPPASRR